MPETLSKTAKASMKQPVEQVRKKAPGEHDHVCPACGTAFTHTDQDCPQIGLAFAPCYTEDDKCLYWFEHHRTTAYRRPGRHIPTLQTAIQAIASMPAPADLPDIYKPELADLLADPVETLCPKMEDGMHCNHWYDGGSCCACKDPEMVVRKTDEGENNE